MEHSKHFNILTNENIPNFGNKIQGNKKFGKSNFSTLNRRRHSKISKLIFLNNNIILSLVKCHLLLLCRNCFYTIQTMAMPMKAPNLVNIIIRYNIKRRKTRVSILIHMMWQFSIQPTFCWLFSVGIRNSVKCLHAKYFYHTLLHSLRRPLNYIVQNLYPLFLLIRRWLYGNISIGSQGKPPPFCYSPAPDVRHQFNNERSSKSSPSRQLTIVLVWEGTGREAGALE